MQAEAIYPDLTAGEYENRITHITDALLEIAKRNKVKSQNESNANKK